MVNRKSRISPSLKRTRSSPSADQPELSAATSILGVILDRVLPRGATTQAVVALTPSTSSNSSVYGTEVMPAPHSPIINTPSKLRRFLDDLKKKGFTNAPDFQYRLESEGFGPDILEHIEKAELVALGISSGNAIRMKVAAPKWWAEEGKRLSKRHRTSPSSKPEARLQNTDTMALGTQDCFPEDRRIRFEKKFVDGGGASYYSSGFRKGCLCEDLDYTWAYYSAEVGDTVPVPDGYVPILAEGECKVGAVDEDDDQMF